MKLVPLGDKIVLKQFEAEETTKSGIVLPGQAKEKPQEALVIAVGPGGNIDGKEVTMQVKVGDKVDYFLLFGYRGGSVIFSGNNDGTVALSSMLFQQAQQEARKVYGFEEDHTSILKSKEVFETVSKVFSEAGTK